MLFFTFLGSVEFYLITIPVILGVLVWRRRWHEFGVILFSVAGALVLNNLLKLAFHRVRPNLYFIKETGYSFPSGHAMITTVFYGIILFLVFPLVTSRVWRNILVALAIFFTIAIGASRIYLGVHYPSDVLGSYLAGLCWLAFSIMIIKSPFRLRLNPRDTDAHGIGE